MLTLISRVCLVVIGNSVTSGMSAAGVTVRLDPMAKHRSASSPCLKLLSMVTACGNEVMISQRRMCRTVHPGN